ncbi:hypothetical protein HED60_13500 [Planctomycetales bacterium ZRK34]|nr:hypothetical protein HED60_13500 [Planctomycetales bacterium ZRK34]
MFRPLSLLPAAMVFVLTASIACAQTAAPAADWIPDTALIVLEVRQPQTLVDYAVDSSLSQAMQSSPQWQQAKAQPNYAKFQQGVAFFERLLETDWRAGITGLTGGGVTLAVLGEDQVVMIADAADVRLLNRLHNTLSIFAQTAAANKGQADPMRTWQHAGINCYSFNATEAHALIDNRLVLASRAAILERVLDLRAGHGEGVMSSSVGYRAALQASSSHDQAAAFTYVNVAAVKQNPTVAAGLNQGIDNPLAALLLAPLADAARQAKWLAATLDVRDQALSMITTTDAHTPAANALTSFAYPSSPDGALANLNTPRRLAAMSFYRDLHAFYAAKDELFPQRTSGLIFFENMMGIFFTGRDLTDEVLGELEPHIRLVVAEQTWPNGRAPQVKLPGFAVVFQMKNPDRFSLVAEEAWQKALGMVNFTRGQQALPGLLIDRPTYAGIKYTSAYFSDAGATSGSDDTRFNLRPCIARVGDHLILSSTESLTCDLIDSLKRESSSPAKAQPSRHSLIEVDGAQLGSILNANRDTLIRKNMIEKGNTQAQAEGEINMLITIVRAIGSARVEVGSRDNHPQITLQLAPAK